MSMWKFPLLTVTGILLLAGCGAPPSLTHENIDQYDKIVARTGSGYELTAADLFTRIERDTLLPDGGILTVDRVREELDRTLVDTLAGLASTAVSLDNHYDYRRLFQLRYYDYLIRKYGQVEIFDKTPLDSQEVVDFYEQNPDRFTRPEEVKAWHILITDAGLKGTADSLYYRTLSADSLAAHAERHAWMVKGLLDDGQPFEQVAREYSHDNTVRLRGGLIGWVGRQKYEDPFDSIAFSLEPGGHSDPYFTSNGWHILFVEERHDRELTPLDDNVRAQIGNFIRSQRADSLARPIIDSLDRSLRLTVNEAMLDTNVFLVPESLWAAVVNDQDTILFADLRGIEEGYRRRHNVQNTTLEMKQQMLRDAARRYCLVQAARAAAIDTLPDVREQEQKFAHQYRKTVFLMDAVPAESMPADSLIEQYYVSHLKEYEIGKPLVVQHILLPDSATAAFVRDQALAGMDFLELADEFYPGEPTIRRELADLGEIGPEDVSPEFYETAWATAIDKVSPPVRTTFGWHIIKVLDRRSALTLDQARPRIIPILKEQERRRVFNAFRDRLYEQFQVSFPNSLRPIQLRPITERTAEGNEG